MQTVDINLPEMMRLVTLQLKVTGMLEQKLRSRIGLSLLRLGARVIGCDVSVEAKGKEIAGRD